MLKNGVGYQELKEVKSLMRSFNFTGEGEPCAYCGVYATDREHLIPISWIQQIMLSKGGEIDMNVPKLVIVKSCREYNLFASSKVFNSFRQKKEYIRKKVEEKYKKLLKGGDWTDEEMVGLTGNLLTYVYAHNELKKLIKKRLEYLKNPNPISLELDKIKLL